jgi:branched-chain amino acid transport system ATP-binding protein
MIEHHVPLVVGLCDYVYVLNFGRLLAKGEPKEIQRHPDVVQAYLGEEAADAAS